MPRKRTAADPAHEKELRYLAAQIAAMLPSDRRDAFYVLDASRNLYTDWICGGTVPSPGLPLLRVMD